MEAAMIIEAILGLPEGLEVRSVDVADEVLTLTVISTQQNPCCPLCGSRASRVHSHYRRHLTDMSCAGRLLSTGGSERCGLPMPQIQPGAGAA